MKAVADSIVNTRESRAFRAEADEVTRQIEKRPSPAPADDAITSVKQTITKQTPTPMPQPSATPSATSAPAPRRHPYVPGMFKDANDAATAWPRALPKNKRMRPSGSRRPTWARPPTPPDCTKFSRGCDGQVPRLREEFVKAFCRVAMKDDVETLKNILGNNRRYIACAIPVAGALMKIDPKAARDVFEKYATNGAVRSSLMAAFIRLDSSYESEIWPLLSSDQRIVADEAVYILGRIGTSKSIPQMQALANDPARSDLASLNRAVNRAVTEIKKREDKKPGYAAIVNFPAPHGTVTPAEVPWTLAGLAMKERREGLLAGKAGLPGDFKHGQVSVGQEPFRLIDPDPHDFLP